MLYYVKHAVNYFICFISINGKKINDEIYG